jgi:hypothetical protein
VPGLKDKSWLELCEAASHEQDPEKLLELVTALNDLLEQRDLEEKVRGATCSMAWGAQHSAPSSFGIKAA